MSSITTGSERGASETLLVERQDGVLIVTLNRPDRLNAIDGGIHDGLITICEELQSDRSIRAVLLRANGRSFCVGGDVDNFADAAADPPSTAIQMADIVKHAAHIVHAFLNVPQPVVAAVQGYAMGLGATLALLCDVVIAADDAQIADTHVSMGLVAGDGGALTFPLGISMGAAKYYLMTGERMSGSEAARLGLVFKAVPLSELQNEALAIARKFAALPPLAVQGTKSTLNRVVKARAALVLDHGLMLEAGTFLSEDHKEAVSAFMGKRQGAYNGR